MSEPPCPARRPEDFYDLYASTPPWDIGRPQPQFLALAEAGELRGRVLDAGCGTGEHTLMAARFGLEATGIDTAATAIEIARRKAKERGLGARFLVWNALDLVSLGQQFDTVLDCGLFHVLDDDGSRSYVENLRAVMAPGGRFFMLCFSDSQPDWQFALKLSRLQPSIEFAASGYWPRRITEVEIRATFSQGWQVESVEPVKIESILEPEIFAWRARITRAGG
jgi:SAM-dependent methyltransferase